VVDRDELIAAAAPPCHECGAPIVRTEVQHKRTTDGWQVSGMITVCAAGHRVPVEPFEEAK
jgi:hypothetical protein